MIKLVEILDEIQIKQPFKLIVGKKYDIFVTDNMFAIDGWLKNMTYKGLEDWSTDYPREPIEVFISPFNDELTWGVSEMDKMIKDKHIKWSNLNEITIKPPKYPLYQLGDINSWRYYFGTENYDTQGWLNQGNIFVISIRSDEHEETEVVQKLKSLNIPYTIEVDGEYDNGWRSYTNVIIENADKYFVFKKS